MRWTKTIKAVRILTMVSLLWLANAANAQVSDFNFGPIPDVSVDIDFDPMPDAWVGSGYGYWVSPRQYLKTGRTGYLASRPSGDKIGEDAETLVIEASLQVDYSSDVLLSRFGDHAGSSCDEKYDGTPVSLKSKIQTGKFHGYPSKTVTLACQSPSYAYRAVDSRLDSWVGSYMAWKRYTCVEITPAKPCIIIIETIDAHVTTPAALGEDITTSTVETLMEEMEAWKTRWKISVTGRSGNTDLPQPSSFGTQPSSSRETNSDSKEEDDSWELAIGAGAAAALAAAVARLLISRRNRRQTEEDPEDQGSDPDEVIGHVLQVSALEIELSPQVPSALEVKVHAVTRDGRYQLATDADIRLRVDGAWRQWLDLKPDQGRAQLTSRLSLRETPRESPGQIEILATTPQGSHTAAVCIKADPPLALEFF